MTDLSYDPNITGLLVVDPYNDFISEGGKIWPRIKAVAEANNCVPHMQHVLKGAREAKLRVFFAMHHRYRAGDYESWKYIAPIQRLAWQRKTFEYGTWGGEFRAEFVPASGEIVASEHWCSSGFANTDLDVQLKRHGIHRLIVIGLIAHTCIEATVRFAAELGYDVTVVKDAVADYSDEMMRAALEINMPNYASAIVTTKEIIDALSGTQTAAFAQQ
ncbi:Isochorismatase-like protein [Lipomyces starkeyi]